MPSIRSKLEKLEAEVAKRVATESRESDLGNLDLLTTPELERLREIYAQAGAVGNEPIDVKRLNLSELEELERLLGKANSEKPIAE